jgi:hypothetical protein
MKIENKTLVLCGEEGGEANFLAINRYYLAGWIRLFPLWSVKFGKTGLYVGHFYREGIALSFFVPFPKIWKATIKIEKFCWKKIDNELYIPRSFLEEVIKDKKLGGYKEL